MHNAPPVVYPLGRSVFQGSILLALWLAGLVATLVWWQSAGPSVWRLGVAGAGLLLAGLVALLGWRQAPDGRLQWDGQEWRWESAAYREGTAVHSLQVALDLQGCLLLRASNPDRAGLWLWAERTSAPERWMDLRRAVYAPHRAPARSADLLPEQHAL